MRPKIFMWSDYGASTQKHWRSPSRRSTRSSIGPKILVVAGGVVAGVIGISGIYPEIIDADWVQSAGTDSPHSKNVAISDATTTRRSGIVAAIPLPPRRVAITTGEAAVSAPRPAAPTPASAPEPEVSEMHTSVAAVELPPSETAPPLADMPDAQAKADPPAEPAAPAPALRHDALEAHEAGLAEDRGAVLVGVVAEDDAEPAPAQQRPAPHGRAYPGDPPSSLPLRGGGSSSGPPYDSGEKIDKSRFPASFEGSGAQSVLGMPTAEQHQRLEAVAR
jgi:hypothetical protein